MSGSAFSEWFEKLWTDREDRVYRSLFGDLGEGVYTAGEATYKRFGKGQPHPGWLNPVSYTHLTLPTNREV